MSATIQLFDQDGKPIANANVHVSWRQGGHSSGTTNESGIVDLGTSAGTANEVRINGRNVVATIWLRDGNTEIRTRR